MAELYSIAARLVPEDIETLATLAARHAEPDEALRRFLLCQQERDEDDVAAILMTVAIFH